MPARARIEPDHARSQTRAHDRVTSHTYLATLSFGTKLRIHRIRCERPDGSERWRSVHVAERRPDGSARHVSTHLSADLSARHRMSKHSHEYPPA